MKLHEGNMLRRRPNKALLINLFTHLLTYQILSVHFLVGSVVALQVEYNG